MKLLSNHWQPIKKKLKRHKAIFILLDFDGTLSPIAPTPKQARLEKNIKKILISLSKKKNTTLGIISGRGLRDIKRLVGVRGIYYAGNHGLEIVGPGIKFIHRKAKSFKSLINKTARDLKLALSGIKGIVLENKKFTISVHYRLAASRDIKEIESRVRKVCTPSVKTKRIKLSGGKKCWEIRPYIKWNKGEAVKRILSKFGKSAIPVYLGDDITDEDAFRALKRKGLTIFVGRLAGKTKAEYNIPTIKGVEKFLKTLDYMYN